MPSLERPASPRRVAATFVLSSFTLAALDLVFPALCPVCEATLGAVFERRGETREAFEEYRRALQLGHAFDWPYRCEACGASAPMWQDRCAQCHRWNALRPLGA